MSKRGSAPPSRRTRRIEPAKLGLLVFAEGIKTEHQYITDWYRRHRDRVTVEFDDRGGAPLTLVKRAVEQKKIEMRDERKGKGRAHSHFWCVFDRDEHPYIPEALSLAEEHGILTAYSNPCIELWFLLHFQEQTAHLERDSAQREWKRHSGCGKNLSPAALAELADPVRFADAKVRALRLDKKHSGDGSPPASNPSSDVWRLIETISGP